MMNRTYRKPIAMLLVIIQLVSLLGGGIHFQPYDNRNFNNLYIISLSNDAISSEAVIKIITEYNHYNPSIVFEQDINKVLDLLVTHPNDPMILVGHGSNLGIGDESGVKITWADLYSTELSTRSIPIMILACGTNIISHELGLKNSMIYVPDVELIDARASVFFVESYLAMNFPNLFGMKSLIDKLLEVSKFVLNPDLEHSLQLLDGGGSGGGSSGSHPSAPRNLALTQQSDGWILSWDAPADTYGLYYQYEIYKNNDYLGATTAQAIYIPFGPDDSSVSGATYTVKAVNTYGSSPSVSKWVPTMDYRTTGLGNLMGPQEYTINLINFVILAIASIFLIAATLIDAVAVFGLFPSIIIGAHTFIWNFIWWASGNMDDVAYGGSMLLLVVSFIFDLIVNISAAVAIAADSDVALAIASSGVTTAISFGLALAGWTWWIIGVKSDATDADDIANMPNWIEGLF